MMATRLAADERRIGVVLVVDVCGHRLISRPFLSSAARRGPAVEFAGESLGGHAAGALQLHDAVAGEQLLEVVELVGMALQAERQRLGADGEDLALEDRRQLEDLAALLGRRRTVASSSSRSTEWRGSSSVILTTSISLNSCLTICSSGADSTSTTIVMPAHPLVLGRGDREREDVEPRRANRLATRASTPAGSARAPTGCGG